MSFMNGFWHLANFLAAPLGVALLLVALSKGVVWRALLKRDPWRMLWLQCALGGLIGLGLGLLIWRTEGKLAVWALMLAGHMLPVAYRLLTR